MNPQRKRLLFLLVAALFAGGGLYFFTKTMRDARKGEDGQTKLEVVKKTGEKTTSFMDIYNPLLEEKLKNVPASSNSCQDVIDFFLSFSWESILFSARAGFLNQEECVKKLTEIEQSPYIKKILYCVKKQKRMATDECKQSLIYYRAFAANSFLEKHPERLKDDKAMMLQKMIWDVAKYPVTTKDEFEADIKRGDILLKEYPKMYELLKLKFILLSVWDIKFGKVLIDKQVFETWEKLINIHKSDADIEELKTLLAIHKDTFYEAQEIQDWIGSFFLENQDHPKSYYYLAYRSLKFEKDMQEAINWLDTGIRVVDDPVLLEETKNDLLNTKDYSKVFHFPIDVQFNQVREQK